MRRLIFLALIPALLFGCKDEEKPINATPGTVPLKVWVIRAPSDVVTEPAILQNKGCRLTDDQIRDRIHHLQNNATTLFGTNIKFEWMPENPTEIQDPSLDAVSIRVRDTTHMYTNLIVGPGNWDFLSINLYFAGDIQHVGPLETYPQFPVPAITFDPKELSDNGITPNRGHVLLNDCGFDSASGFPDRAVTPGPNPTIIAFDPASVTSYNIFEHEMTHYLARFTSTCFPVGSSNCYSTTEHSLSANNILRVGIIPPPTLFLPGKWDDPSTERGQIWDRVLGQRWNTSF